MACIRQCDAKESGQEKEKKGEMLQVWGQSIAAAPVGAVQPTRRDPLAKDPDRVGTQRDLILGTNAMSYAESQSVIMRCGLSKLNSFLMYKIGIKIGFKIN